MALYSISHAQVSPGARQIALSQSDIAQSNDVFALFNNPSGLAQISWREFGVYYSPSPFGVQELANAYASYTEPFAFGNISVGYMQYGFELYKENKIALSFSRRFDSNFFLGATLLYQNLAIERYGNDDSYVLNLGGLYYFQENFRIGVRLHNLTRSTYGDEADQIPFIMATGLSYDFNNDITFNGAVEKELDFDPSFRFGVEYRLIEYVSMRTGFMSEPSSYSIGIGIHYSFSES
ncbi:MAG: hypothetical protein U5K00_21660 [Melioribacteraceae bacterium]|nr:hypothetical protein [Melioribacteraceae bacterium]